MPTNPYDRDHQTHRADWNQLIQNNHQPRCQRCGKPIHPGQPWDLGHTRDLALGGNPNQRQPEHADCNRSAGAALSTSTPPSRVW